MPPMLSDDESMSDGVDVPEVVPAKAAKGKGKGKGKVPAKPVSEDEQEDGSDEEEAEDEYSVDKILEHRFERGGAVKYKVKWLGYEDEADMTWEPAANLETAPEKLKEYHANIGGTPQPKGKKKGGAQKRTASEALDSPAPSASKRRGGRKSQVTNGADDAEEVAFTLPKGSWESEVSHVMSIVEEDEPDEKKPGKTNKCLMGFVQWNDDRKSKHPMKTLRTKCPQALLTYYENHLVFAKTEDVPSHLKTENGE